MRGFREPPLYHYYQELSMSCRSRKLALVDILEEAACVGFEGVSVWSACTIRSDAFLQESFLQTSIMK